MVCHKPAGLATQTNRIGQPDLVSECKNYAKTPYLALIHRLDQPVEGVLVLAKDKQSAAVLSKQLMQHQLSKRYLAKVYGIPSQSEQKLCDYLLEGKGNNITTVVNKDVKGAAFAKLSYQTLKKDEAEGTALLEIDLETGRHHQIRVQLAHMGCPICGDLKYGSEASIKYSIEKKIPTVALCAYHLEFVHPKTKKKMIFQCVNPEEWSLS